MATSDRSFSEVLHDILGNFQEITRAELRLAKTEIRAEVGKAKPAGVLLSAGALGGVFCVLFLLLASVYALTRVMPDWAAALTVAAAVGIMAAAMVSTGMARWKQVHSPFEKPAENIKETVEWLKQQSK